MQAAPIAVDMSQVVQRQAHRIAELETQSIISDLALSAARERIAVLEAELAAHAESMPEFPEPEEVVGLAEVTGM